MTKIWDCSTLFGFQLLRYDSQALMRDIIPALLTQSSFTTLTTLNPEIIVHAEKYPIIKAQLVESLCLCDGAGLSLAHRLLKGEPIIRVPGIEMVTQLVASQRFKVFLIGGAPEVMDKTLHRLKMLYPNLVVNGHHGFFKEDERELIIEALKAQKPDIVLVGMGFPLQEHILASLKQQLHYGLGIGVGGTFDIWSQAKKRAPLVFQKTGLEWLYRTVQDPKRFSRLGFIPRFIKTVWQERSLKNTVVPRAGLEPARTFKRSTDFKSVVSTNSTTPAGFGNENNIAS
jgi:N-acetylglucosaminyldiphosphoundecaprenol N-acetyl-beta-D-mannosaminyltransferase